MVYYKQLHLAGDCLKPQGAMPVGVGPTSYYLQSGDG